jgi:hypothetical protein
MHVDDLYPIYVVVLAICSGCLVSSRQRHGAYPSARGPSTSGGTLITPKSMAALTASTSGPELVLLVSVSREAPR